MSAQKWIVAGRSPKSKKRMFLTKKNTFATSGKAREFAHMRDATRVAHAMMERHPQLRGYSLFVDQAKPIQRKNPSGYARARDGMLAEIDAAAEKFEEFTGFRATKETRYPTPRHKTGFALGKLVGVIYEQNRKGDGLSQYRHDFKSNCRPQLVSSLDGSQLVIVGGRYRVSEETGINDEP